MVSVLVSEKSIPEYSILLLSFNICHSVLSDWSTFRSRADIFCPYENGEKQMQKSIARKNFIYKYRLIVKPTVGKLKININQINYKSGLSVFIFNGFSFHRHKI